jgi:hypothetical protein
MERYSKGQMPAWFDPRWLDIEEAPPNTWWRQQGLRPLQVDATWLGDGGSGECCWCMCCKRISCRCRCRQRAGCASHLLCAVRGVAGPMHAEPGEDPGVSHMHCHSAQCRNHAQQLCSASASPMADVARDTRTVRAVFSTCLHPLHTAPHPPHPSAACFSPPASQRQAAAAVAGAVVAAVEVVAAAGGGRRTLTGRCVTGGIIPCAGGPGALQPCWQVGRWAVQGGGSRSTTRVF